jgi:hypothetical protein
LHIIKATGRLNWIEIITTFPALPFLPTTSCEVRSQATVFILVYRARTPIKIAHWVFKIMGRYKIKNF